MATVKSPFCQGHGKSHKSNLLRRAAVEVLESRQRRCTFRLIEELESRVMMSLTAPGYYSATGQAPGIPAPPGTYVSTSGATAPTVDPIGYYTNQPASVAPIPAPVGTYVGVTGATAPTVDVPGYFNNQIASTAAIPAPLGSYVPAADASSATLASPGFYVGIVASIAETPAPLGTYVPTAGASAPTPAPAGSYVSTVGATAATPAPLGSYVPTAGASAPTLAPAGSYVPTVGATSATPARLGTYVPTTGASAPTLAPAGSYVSTVGATSAMLAPLGTYVPTAGASAPTLAPAGSYVPTVGATSAMLAPLGSYVPTAGASAPTLAPAGSYVPTVGATSATPAPLGTYVPTAGASAPTLAPAGSYVSTIGATSATPAPLGSYVPTAGASAPALAPAGSYVSTIGATLAMLAPPGTYVPTAGASAPTPAPAGSYVATVGATSATPAPLGSYVPTAGAIAPTLAPAGSYVATVGATAATPASPGYYVANAGAAQETPASPGYYVPSAGATQEIQDPPGTWSGVAATSYYTLPPILYVNASAAAGGNGTSWATAFNTLQAALAALAAAGPNEQIWVEKGTYTTTSGTDRTVSFALDAGVAVYGGFAGTETLLSQRNWVQNVTTLSGQIGTLSNNSGNSYHVVTSNGLNNTAVLDGFTITAGNANGIGPEQDNGGGMFNDNSSPTLTHLTFTGNSASNFGGAIYNESSSPTMTDLAVTGNSATNFGGGIYNDSSSPTLVNATFSGNSSNFGGGVFDNSSAPTLTNVSFSTNSANDYGGGVDNYFSSVTLTNCILWGNSAVSGGAQINDDNGASTVTYSDAQGGLSGTGNINANPLFVSATQGNLRLLAGSPAIGAGTSAGAPAFDLDGKPRPVGSIDMGAYQDQTSNLVTTLGQLIPGGPTGNNPLVPPFDQVMAALTAPRNIPAAAAALKTFTSTAVGEVASPASGVNVNTLITLLTGVGDLTNDIGTTVYVPPATQAVYIGSFVLLADNIPGGLTGGNALVPYWEQGVIGLVEQNFPGTIAALQSFTSTAVGEVASATSGVNINTLITLLTGVGDLTNALGATIYVPVATQTLYITNFEILANAIPGGLTGGNSLVPYWEQAITALVEQNIPATAAALRSFINTAVSESSPTLSLSVLTTLETAVVALENGLGITTPSVSITPSLSSPLYGQPLNLTAAVTNPSGPAPAGAVQFIVDGIALGNPVPLGASGQAVSPNISSLSAGTHTYSAVFISSTSPATGVASASLTVGQTGSVLTPVAVTAAYGGSATLSTTLTTSGGTLLAGRTVTFSVNGKTIGTSTTNSSGVATLGASVSGIAPGVYAAAIRVSFAGDANSTAASATTSLTVQDAPIIANVSASALLNVALVTGSFTQARTGATASDFVATVNWGDGSATQPLLILPDLLHPGQFDLVSLSHIYLKLGTKFTVTLTLSTTAKFGTIVGATTTIIDTITA